MEQEQKKITAQEVAQIGAQLLQAAPQIFITRDTDGAEFVQFDFLAASAYEFLESCYEEVHR